MSRLRLEENEDEDDSIGHPYQQNAYRREGPGPARNKNAMDSLASELDKLTRSLDSKVSLQDLVGGKGQSHERVTRDLYLGTETMNPRNSSYSSAANRTRDTDTSQLEPPVNLKSPPFRLFSPPVPVPTPSSNRDKKKPADAQSRLFQTSGTTGKASSNNHPIDPPPSPVRPSSWQPILEDMRQTLEEKDERIRTLEEENEYLRSQLQRLEQVGETLQQRQSTGKATTRTTPNREENHQQRRQRRRQQPTNKNGNDDIFSPGTKFVAELAQLVEIEVGHHAPLSYIMDKYWDKLAPYDEEE